MTKKLKPNGFNLYKDGKFWMVITQGEDEDKVVKDIKSYLSINNFNSSQFSYKQFKNHSTEGFEMKTVL